MIIKKQARKKEIVQEVQEPVSEENEASPLPSQEELKNDAFDIDKIDFTQRQERRRGDRRRGYRRIDDRNLISRAQEEADQIKESAAKEGYKAGLEEARNDILDLRESIANFISAKKEVFEYIAPDILEISVEIARKIIKKELEQDPQAIITMILEVMENLSKDETKITIRVNPMQADLVREELPKALSAKGTEARITVTADDSVETGGCVFLTSNGIIDAGLDTQLEILKEALKGM